MVGASTPGIAAPGTRSSSFFERVTRDLITARFARRSAVIRLSSAGGAAPPR